MARKSKLSIVCLLRFVFCNANGILRQVKEITRFVHARSLAVCLMEKTDLDSSKKLHPVKHKTSQRTGAKGRAQFAWYTVAALM